VLKDIILVTAALVIVARTFCGGRLVAATLRLPTTRKTKSKPKPSASRRICVSSLTASATSA
jgi:hypothetical protein